MSDLAGRIFPDVRFAIKSLRRSPGFALIAIVTLGATRPFLIRPLGGGPSRNVRPGSGDLLIMGGRCQHAWEHGVPKVATCGPRISVTLRWSSNRAPLTGPL
jgi:hypothetical protein